MSATTWSCGQCTYTHSSEHERQSRVCVLCNSPQVKHTDVSSEPRKSRKHKLEPDTKGLDPGDIPQTALKRGLSAKASELPEKLQSGTSEPKAMNVDSAKEDMKELPLERATSGDDWGDDAAGDAWGDDSAAKWGTVEVAGDDQQALEEQIPSSVKQRVIEDVKELKLISRFVAAEINFGGGTQMTLRLGLPVSFLGLNKEQSLAWGVDRSQIICLELQFPPHYFNITKTTEIKLKVGLVNRMTNPLQSCGFSWSLAKAIRKDCLGQLRNRIPERAYNAKDVEQVAEIASVSYLVALAALRDAKPKTVDGAVSILSDKAKRKLLRTACGDEEKEEKQARAPAVVVNPDVKQLIDICHVTVELAELALRVETKVEDAIEILTQPETRKELEQLAQAGAKRVQVVGANANSKDLKLIEALTGHNYLVLIMVFLEGWVKRCNNFCTICGSQLKYVGIKPAICGEALCKMGQEEMGLGMDIATEVKERPEVLDLLLTLLVSGANSKSLLVTPAHVNVLYKGIPHRLCNDAGELDSDRLKQALDNMPSLDEMTPFAFLGTLNDFLDKIDPLIGPLIRWCISSSRAHLRRLLPHEQLDVGTPHQFVLLSTPPELELRWQSERRTVELTGKKGAVLTWHGSSTSNWHSILRIGLKNMSNSIYMTTGAAMGSGIYMATDSATSMGYCKSGGGWAKSTFGPNCFCLALCEVVNHPDLRPPTPYYVVTQEEWVATRYLFVFDKHGSKSVNAESLRSQLPRFEVDPGTLMCTSGSDHESVDEETRRAVDLVKQAVHKVGSAKSVIKLMRKSRIPPKKN